MFLQEISLLTNADSVDESDDFVTLMTIHSSKGLEFSHVYIVGMEEDLFPSQMMLSSRADLEEERRLFYVALTRAETKLTLSYALSRYRFGRLKSCEASRFITEINPDFIKQVRKPSSNFGDSGFSEEETASSFTGNYAGLLRSIKNTPVSGFKKEGVSPASGFKKVSAATGNGFKAPVDFVPSDTSNLAVGMTVEHPKFGMGQVVEMDITGDNRKAKVNFSDFGEKTLLLSFAKIKIHEN
jgi:DNA helicase-2/ATP-dependent DNA helicase PcrA